MVYCLPDPKFSFLHHFPEVIFDLHDFILFLFPLLFSTRLHVLIEHLQKGQWHEMSGQMYNTDMNQFSQCGYDSG